MTYHHRKDVAGRRFVAIQGTIVGGISAALGATAVAHALARPDAHNSGVWLSVYALVFVLAGLVSAGLAYALKDMLKSRNRFRLDYIVAGVLAVMMFNAIFCFTCSFAYFELSAVTVPTMSLAEERILLEGSSLRYTGDLDARL